MRRQTTRLAAVIMILAATLVASIGVPDPSSASATSGIDFGLAGAAEIATFIGLPVTPVATPTPTPVVHLYLGLASDRVALEARARAVSDPASPDYGRHGTVAQEGAALNATPQTIATVSDWFATRSVALVLDPTSSYFEGDVPLPVAEEAFGQAYGTYSLGSAVPPDVVLLTPILAPTSVAPGLAGLVDRVYGAVGLYDTTTNLPMAVEDAASGSPAAHQISPHPGFPLQPAGGGTPWRTGTASDACAGADAVTVDGRPMGLSPGQLRTAYGIDALWNLGFKGRGARIAVVDENLYDPSDLAAYRSCFGVEGTAVTPHLIGNPVLGPGTDETTLDLEVMTAVAPEADRIDWFAVDTTSSPLSAARNLFDMLVAPLDASLTGGVNPDVISSSFGVCEEFLGQSDPGFAPLSNLLDQVLATAVASGVGVFVASFDDGSSGCFRFLPAPAQFAAAVVWPSTNRWVTAVGGHQPHAGSGQPH